MKRSDSLAEPRADGEPVRQDGQRDAATRMRVVNPVLAEMIANMLRDRILSGQIVGTLPRQEDLVDEFHVSPPSVREALRILQAEGLVTVKRGSVGGALVHIPGPDRVAYVLGMILQSRNAVLEDVGAAMGIMEPACAASCAARPDRRATVVPALRDVVARSYEVIDDPFAYMRLAIEFHAEIVSGSGNHCVTVMLGALDALLSAHLQSLALRATRHGIFPDLDSRLRSHQEHVQLVDAIDAGDPSEAEKLLRLHLSDPAWRTRILGTDRPVRAGVVRDI